MTPRPFSSEVVTMRLTLMQELLDDIDEVGPVDVDRLATDRITRRALERILTQLVDLAIDVNTHIATTHGGPLTTEYRASFDAVVQVGALETGLAERLKPSVGLRNVLVHEYLATDPERLAASVPLARAGYGDYVRRIAAWLRSR